MGWGLNLFLLFHGVFIGVVYGVYHEHRTEGRDLSISLYVCFTTVVYYMYCLFSASI